MDMIYQLLIKSWQQHKQGGPAAAGSRERSSSSSALCGRRREGARRGGIESMLEYFEHDGTIQYNRMTWFTWFAPKS